MSKNKKRLPGSEKLTRPEEISALSKYLGNIKKVQEEHTTLNPDNLEVPGRTTGKIPNIEKLPGNIQHLDVENKVSLEEGRVGLEGNLKDTESLSEFREDLENIKTIDTLDETKLGLENTNSETNLEETRVGLEISNNIDTLGETRLDLEDDRETELENTKLAIEDSRENSLEDTKLNLETKEDIDTLEDTRINLEDKRDIGLGNTKINLEDKRESTLETTKLTLEDNRETILEDTKLALEDGRKIDLEDTKLALEDSREITLGDTKINLEDSREAELEDTKLTLEDSRDTNLEDTRLNLEINEDTSLEDTKINLEDNRETNLSDTRLNLEDERDISLGDERLNLDSDNETEELEDTKLILEDSREVNLGETRVDLGDITSTESLEDTRLLLDVEEQSNLEDTKLTLEVNKEVTLEDTKINLEDSRETNLSDAKISLEDTKLTLEVNKDTSLGDTKLNLEDNRDTTLEDTKLTLEVNEDTGLEDTKLTLEDNRETELEDTKLTLEDNRETELEDTKLTLEDSRETNLEDTKLVLEDSRDTSLEDTKLTLEDDRETELESFLDSITDERDVTLSDTIINGIDEVEIDSLYDSVLGMPETSTPDAREDGEATGWEEKLREEKIQRPDSNVSPGWNETLLDESSRISTPSSDTSDAREDGQPTGWSEGLYDSALDIPETSTSDSREDGEATGWGEELYDSLINAPEDQKYFRILDMAATLGPWGSKVASLVSAVLSNEVVGVQTAAWYDGELKKVLQQMGIMDSFNHSLKSRVMGDNNQKALDLIDAATSVYTGKRIEMFGDKIDMPNDPRLVPGPDGIIPERTLPDYTSYTVEMPNANKEGQSDYIYNSETGEDRTGDTLFEHIIVDTFSPSKSGSRDRGYKTIPKYQFPSGGLDALNINNFIRLGAERLFDLWDPRTVTERRLKTILLDETIALLVLAREQLEKLTKANRDRLPGDDMGLISDLMTGGVSGALDTVKDAALGALSDVFGGAKGVDTTNPLNRPKTKLTGKGYLREQTTGFDRGNARTTASDVYTADKKDKWKNLANNLVNSLIGGLADKWGAKRDISFGEKYIKNSFGTVRTISELCNLTDPEKVESVEALFELLKTSPYITTPYKFGTLDSGRYGAMTLDTNAYWEVIIEPFCHTQMNGGYSFLPSIQEINIINQITHGVTTGYSKWLPVTSFELQKSKLDTKTIGLYSGEFSIPTVAELSNELRITMIDDSYKSWRNYFQKCMDVSVYSSESHTAEYYYKDKYTAMQDWKQANTTEDTSDDFNAILNVMKNKGGIEYPTIVDKSRPIAALYKNVTFQIQIYIMTPQYSTIRRFNLLCVLNGFEESAAGDIDAGGYDLNLSFSIVGENPKPDAKVENLKPKKEAFNPKIGDYSPSNSKSDSLIKLL